MKHIITILLSVVISATAMGQNIYHIHQNHDESHPHFPVNIKESYPLKSTREIKQSLDSIVLKIYNWSTMQWEDDQKYEYTYDNDGNKISTISYLINENTGSWVNSAKWVTNYDTNEQSTETISYAWMENNGQWVNSYQWVYTYDENGNETSYSYYAWNDTTAKWKGSEKYEYTYDANGNITTFLSYEWDENANQWVNFWKAEYTYNLAYALDELLLPPFDFYTLFGLNVIANMPVDYISYYFADNIWYEYGKTTYYYSEVSTGVWKIPEPGIKVFPNPATDYIVLDIDNISPSALIEMFNIQGKKVLHQVVNGKNISVGQLTEGFYTYKINDNGKVYNGKIVVE